MNDLAWQAYRDRLAALPAEGWLARSCDRRIVLLTGQSSFAHARLRPAQRAFLRAVAPVGFEPIEVGFPFHAVMAAPDGAADDEESIAGAALRNALQFFAARTDARYRAVLAHALQRVVDATGQALVVVTGSCGLELAARAWPALAIPPGLRVRVIALGPASRGRLPFSTTELTCVQGRKDRWSRRLHRGPVAFRPDCGHLDYYDDAATIAWTRATLIDAMRDTP